MRCLPVVCALLVVGWSHGVLAGELQREIDRVTLTFPLALPGEEVVLVKGLDEKGRVVQESPSHPEFTLADLDKLRARELELQRERFGNLGHDLQEVVGRLGDADVVAVTVALRRPELPHLDKYRHTEAELAAHSRAFLSLPTLVAPDEIVARYGLLPRNAETVAEDGLLEADVNGATLRRMMFDPAIATIDRRYEPEEVYNFSTYNTSAFNPAPLPYRAAGSGVKAGTFESGVHPNHISCMGLTSANIAQTASSASINDHSNQTFKAMWNSAPSATHYHRDSWSYNAAASQTWIVNNGVQTLSQSTTSGGSATSNLYRVMDDFSYRAPFTLFANPTANSGFGLVANWQQYNGLSVGNTRETYERYYELPGCTQTTNPKQVYGPEIALGVGDWEMPQVVAPGYHPDPNDAGAVDPCLGSFGLWCGTSISAPVANGLAASVISADTRLRNSTEKVKLALILTARNVEGGTWASGVDERDGAGVLSGADAVWFARNHTTVAPGGEARHGMASGSLTNAQEATVLSFSVRTPNVLPIGKRLRAALVWTSNPELNASVNSLSDLDLTLSTTGGTVLAGSYSRDDNVEMVDLAPGSLAPNTLYTLKVHVVDMRITPNASAQFSYYAVGWTWVQDIFVAAPQRGGYEVGVQVAAACNEAGPAATLLATANKLCTEMGNKAGGLWVNDGPRSGVHSWWNGSVWATSGNSKVCYIKDLRCEAHDEPHFANPAPVTQYQLGVAVTPCAATVTHNNTAARFCQDQGYDTYRAFSLDGPKSGVHSWWNGSAWATSGNSNVCYITNLSCKNL